jgi:hypothetical protein
MVHVAIFAPSLFPYGDSLWWLEIQHAHMPTHPGGQKSKYVQINKLCNPEM